ncbi:MAG: class I SAM-dependent methyltransferase [Bacillota bacterium]
MSNVSEQHVMDQAKAEAFAQQVMDILNHGALGLMISIGHRTGLFDTLAPLPPSTAAEIAAAAGLNERYVREWLAAMVVGRIVEYDAEAATYHLPPEHALWLTRSTPAENLARTAQGIGMLAEVEDPIIECFKKGGGVPYSAYSRFHDFMAEDSRHTVVNHLHDLILPAVPGLVEALGRGIDVMDIGCGRGEALMEMARHFPNSRFVGYDISEEALEYARNAAAQRGLTNLRYEVQDAAQVHDVARFDLITAFDAIHDQAQPRKVLANIRSALREGGTFLMQDIKAHTHLHDNLDHPLGPLFYTISTMHCMSVSLAAGGEGLGTMWGREKALELLTQTGFAEIEVKELEHDITNDYYICKR